MTKKILCFIALAFTLVCLLASCGETAPEPAPSEIHTSYDAFKFYPLSSDTYTVTIADEGKYYEEIIIPSTYNGGTVVEIADEGFKECKNLRHITLPNTITEIGNYAFEGSGLYSISFTSSVKSIGTYAFRYCYIRNVFFEGTTKDWMSIFFSPLSDGGTSNPLHNGADLYINDELLTEVKASDFSTFDPLSKKLVGCTSIESVSLPENITYIGTDVFSGCRRLQNITIPDSVTWIGENAFYNCNALKTINIPNGVTDIGNSAFENCGSLENVVFEDGSALTKIGTRAFAFCSSLKTFETPSGVNVIYEEAFRGCTALESISLPNAITVIENYTFYNCSSLKEIVLPHGISRIGRYAFGGCSKLENITISILVLNINPYAFSDCSSLKEIHYQGDKFMWNLTINKGSDWDKNTGNYIVSCTDGTISK